ncbi:hypothetical protein A9Q96_02275 [Rhodobacterales bacterium 52_120_T64]|nr:hypothetical protein A9Q96_02275 [Rhodobacterales bacterium 52_120_T64]
MFDRPTLYFRRKSNGAAIYRVATGAHARLDMIQIGILKHNGEVKPSGKQEPTEVELVEIAAWYDARKADQKTRDTARVDQLVGDMNAVAQWVQTNANDSQITQSAQPILMAMHDLRTTLVRRLSDQGK